MRAYKQIEATLAVGSSWTKMESIPTPEEIFPSLRGLRDPDDDEHLIVASFEAFKQTATRGG